MVLAALASAVIWAAFGTVAGYFLLNQHRLERLVAEIQAVPAIVSLELGEEDESFEPSSGSPGGRQGNLSSYDTYRFINGTMVTHYHEQAALDAAQPVHYLDDMLRSLHVPAERYWDLRRSLERLSLGGYSRDPEGQFKLHEPAVGGQPWGYGCVFSPDGELSYRYGMQEAWRLAPHWFYVLWGLSEGSARGGAAFFKERLGAGADIALVRSATALARWTVSLLAPCLSQPLAPIVTGPESPCRRKGSPG